MIPTIYNFTLNQEGLGEVNYLVLAEDVIEGALKIIQEEECSSNYKSFCYDEEAGQGVFLGQLVDDADGTLIFCYDEFLVSNLYTDMYFNNGIITI